MIAKDMKLAIQELNRKTGRQEGLESEWTYEISVEVPFRAGDIIEINNVLEGIRTCTVPSSVRF